jgi:hypothetical protein
VGWREVLDDMEDRLADVDRHLSTGGPAVAPLALPEDLGPLPDDLRARAGRTLSETRAKLALAEAARDGLADGLRQGRASTRGSAAYLDTWA